MADVDNPPPGGAPQGLGQQAGGPQQPNNYLQQLNQYILATVTNPINAAAIAAAVAGAGAPIAPQGAPIAAPAAAEAQNAQVNRHKRFPAPQTFSPPLKADAEAVQYVHKYLFDLTNYCKHGVADDVPPSVAFSNTSERTFELVQAMTQDEAATGQALSMDEVCKRIKDRYLPELDLAHDARTRLLGNKLKQGTQNLVDFYAEFRAEVARAGNTLTKDNLVITLFNALNKDLQNLCISDGEGKLFHDPEALYQYALGKERVLKHARPSAASRINVLQDAPAEEGEWTEVVPPAKKAKLNQARPANTGRGGRGANRGGRGGRGGRGAQAATVNTNSGGRGASTSRGGRGAGRLGSNPAKLDPNEVLDTVFDCHGRHYTRQQLRDARATKACINCRMIDDHASSDCPIPRFTKR